MAEKFVAGLAVEVAAGVVDDVAADSTLRRGLGQHGDVVVRERDCRDFGSGQTRDRTLHSRRVVTVGRRVVIAMRYHVPRWLSQPAAQDPFWRPFHVSSSRVRIRRIDRILDRRRSQHSVRA